MAAKHPIISRREAAARAKVSPAAISAAIERGELTKATRLDYNEYRLNGVYIYDDGFFKAYCDRVEVTNYRKSGRKKFGEV